MRRRLANFIPIVLFAVVVQLLAPIGAFRAVASSVGDPLAMASICSGMTSASESQHAPAPLPAAQCCAFCVCVHGGAAASSDFPVAVAPWRPEFYRVAWFDPDSLPSAVRTGSNAQARAPPVA
jgi:hypothetical protein